MASFGDWLNNGIQRTKAGVNPLAAFFTPAPTAGAAMGKNTYAAPTTTPAAPSAGSSVIPGPYSGGGSGSYDADLDPAMIAKARGQVSPLMEQLNTLYAQLDNQINDFGRDRQNQIMSQADETLGQNANKYQTAVDGTNQQFTARNTYDSSYRGNANKLNENAYDESNTAVTRARDENLANLGQVVAANRATVANKPKYDLSMYNDVSSLLNLRDELDNHIGSLRSASSNLMTNSQMKSQLDSLAPATSDLDSKLKSQLDALIASNAAPEAKYGIGSGYVKSSALGQADKDKWSQYLASVLGASSKSGA